MSKKFEPLRVCQPCQRFLRFFGRFGIVFVLTIGVLMLPTPEGLSLEGHRAVAATVFTGALLALQPVSLPIAGLLVPVILISFGLADSTLAFEPFSRPVIFLVLGSLFLAEAMRKHGLTRRLALLTVVASKGNISKLLFGIMGIAALFSMWVENTAIAAVLIPVALTISREIHDVEKARELLSLLVLGIAYSASLGGMVTIMGSASNAVTSGFLAALHAWSFIDWMRFGLPVFLLLFPVTWWIVQLLVPVSIKQLDIESASQELNKKELRSPFDREIIITMAVTILLWIMGSVLEGVLILPSTLLSPAVIAVVTVAYLSMRGVINWEDVKGISWGFLFIIGAGLSLGEALSRTGATDWFASLIGPIITQPPMLVSLLFLILLSALLTNVINNATVAVVFVPMLINIAQSSSVFTPLQLVLPVAFATTFGYSLPSASGRMALISTLGIIDRKEMIRSGLVLTVISSIILAVFFYGLLLLNWI